MIQLARGKAEVPAPRSGVVIPLAVEPEEGPDLHTAYDRYRAVTPRIAPDLVATPEVAQARVTLIRALIEDGWAAPDVVRERLRLDEELLRPRLVVAS